MAEPYDFLWVVLPLSGPSDTATFGGIFAQPELAVAYMSAARSVIDAAAARGRLSELAAPAVFLQRHASELLLKELLGAANGLAYLAKRVDRLQKGEFVPPDLQEVPFEHDLMDLLERLRRAMADAGIGKVPRDLVSLAIALSTVEGQHHDRLRYAHVFERRTKTKVRSFPAKVTIPVVEIQELVEAVFKGVYVGVDGEPALMTTLADEDEALAQKVAGFGIPREEV